MILKDSILTRICLQHQCTVSRPGCAPAMADINTSRKNLWPITQAQHISKGKYMHIAPFDNQNKPIVDVDDPTVPLKLFQHS